MCLDQTLTKAFAAKNLKARLAYFDLAEFYHAQARTSCPPDRCPDVRLLR
jgi:hypothetical protein